MVISKVKEDRRQGTTGLTLNVLFHRGYTLLYRHILSLSLSLTAVVVVVGKSRAGREGVVVEVMMMGAKAKATAFAGVVFP